MNSIEIFNQQELDAVPIDFQGKIIIRFGTLSDRAIVNKKYELASVEARENSSVTAWGYAQVCVYSAKSATAHDKARIIKPTESLSEFMIYHAIQRTDECSL